jgi:malonate-semialdehyde dehydrogenase (acetylating)/methylmalonate-semialdehyde dehydrogenase
MTEIAERPIETADAGAELGHVSHWIGGQLVEGASGRRGPVYDPATGQAGQVGRFCFGRRGRQGRWCRLGSVPEWRATSLSKRTEIMFRIRNLVDQRRKEIAALLTAEHGKVPSDALGEVARGLENLEFACGIPH